MTLLNLFHMYLDNSAMSQTNKQYHLLFYCECERSLQMSKKNKETKLGRSRCLSFNNCSMTCFYLAFSCLSYPRHLLAQY